MRKKTLLLILCVVLIGSLSVAGTVAYFTDTEAAKNTFTVGEVGLTLDEAPVDENGQKKEGGRVQENEYQLIPGYSYDKDPTVHINADSSDAWIFVRVVNGIAAIEGTPTVDSQMTANGWTEISGEDGVYAYKDIVSAGDNILVFEAFTVDGNKADGKALDTYKGKTITVTAYAIQAEGFDTSELAWAAYKMQNEK